MKKKYIVFLFLLTSCFTFSWMGIEDESITGYSSLYSSLFSRAIMQKDYFVNKSIEEIEISEMKIKGYGFEEKNTTNYLKYEDGKLIEDKLENKKGILLTNREYNYDENGKIAEAISYSNKNIILKKSEYIYNENMEKINYISYNKSGQKRVEHNYFYSTLKNGKKVISEERVINAAGINVITIRYEYDENLNMVKCEFFDYHDELLRKQEYSYNSENMLSKLITYNEFLVQDGEFEYNYNSDKNIDKISYKRSSDEFDVTEFRFYYDDKGYLSQKDTVSILEASGNIVEKLTNKSTFKVKSKLVSKKSNNTKNTSTEENILYKDTQNIEVVDRVNSIYKNNKIIKQNEGKRYFYKINNKNDELSAYLFKFENFDYSGEISIYVIINIDGQIKDVFIPKKPNADEFGLQLLKKMKWFKKFKKINVNTVNTVERNFNEKIDGIAGATVTSDSVIISVWRAIDLYNHIVNK